MLKTQNGKLITLATATLAALSLAGAVNSSVVKADKADMIDAPKATSAVNNKYSGSYTDFNAKVIPGTTEVYPFGGGADNWGKATTGSGTNVVNWNAVKLTGNENLKGKIGMMYRNVGQYEGHTIDMKITIMDWYRNPADSLAKHPPKTIYAAFGVNDFQIYDPDATAVKYRVDYVDHDTGKPVKLSGQWTFMDIDSNQWLQLDKDTYDHIDNIYYSGTHYGTDDTWLSYHKGHTAFYGDANKHHEKLGDDGTVKSDDKKAGFTATYSNADHFVMTWVSGRSFGDKAPANQATISGDENLWNLTGKYDPNASKNKIDNVYIDVPRSTFQSAFLQYGGKAVLPNKPPMPKKFVSDSDEGTDTPAEVGTNKSVKHDLLKDRYEHYHYQIQEGVPAVKPEFKYNKFVIYDQLDKVLDCGNVHVYNAAHQDVTDDFTVNIDGNNKLTVTAKDHSLQRDDFYRETYTITFDAKVKPGLSLADHQDPKHKDQAVINNTTKVETNYGSADGNNTTTNIPFTKEKDHKTVSIDGDKDTESLDSVDFGKEYKYRVDYAVPDNVNVDSLELKDTIVPEVQNIKDIKVIDADDNNKDITSEGKLNSDTKTGVVTWNAKEANKWHGKHIKMYI